MSRRPRDGLGTLLPTLPAIALQGRLVRCVPYLDFEQGKPPQYLFTSGRRNRCNPEGVRCLYFAQDEATADIEYRHAWHGSLAEHQPKLTSSARCTCAGPSIVATWRWSKLSRFQGTTFSWAEAGLKPRRGEVILSRRGGSRPIARRSS